MWHKKTACEIDLYTNRFHTYPISSLISHIRASLWISKFSSLSRQRMKLPPKLQGRLLKRRAQISLPIMKFFHFKVQLYYSFCEHRPQGKIMNRLSASLENFDLLQVHYGRTSHKSTQRSWNRCDSTSFVHMKILWSHASATWKTKSQIYVQILWFQRCDLLPSLDDLFISCRRLLEEKAANQRSNREIALANARTAKSGGASSSAHGDSTPRGLNTNVSCAINLYQAKKECWFFKRKVGRKMGFEKLLLSHTATVETHSMRVNFCVQIKTRSQVRDCDKIDRYKMNRSKIRLKHMIEEYGQRGKYQVCLSDSQFDLLCLCPCLCVSQR